MKPGITGIAAGKLAISPLTLQAVYWGTSMSISSEESLLGAQTPLGMVTALVPLAV